jgi:hypothetical protein
MPDSGQGPITKWIGGMRAGELAAAQPLGERYLARMVDLARALLRASGRSDAASDEEVAALARLTHRGGTIMSVKRLASIGLGLSVLFMVSPASHGHFRPSDLQTVPIERLVINLEAAVKKEPKNVQALVNLARVHGAVLGERLSRAGVAG